MHSYFFQNISRTDAWNKLPFETVIDQYYVLNITYFQMQIMEKKHLLCNIKTSSFCHSLKEIL